MKIRHIRTAGTDGKRWYAPSLQAVHKEGEQTTLFPSFSGKSLPYDGCPPW